MTSAFGIEHWFAKAGSEEKVPSNPHAHRYTRDELGRFAKAHAKGKKDLKKEGPLSEDDLDEQFDWYHSDIKNLSSAAFSNKKEHRRRVANMEEDAHYWHGRKEHDLANDLWTAVDTSWDTHDKYLKKKS